MAAAFCGGEALVSFVADAGRWICFANKGCRLFD
jgi:hypothetical protein